MTARMGEERVRILLDSFNPVHSELVVELHRARASEAEAAELLREIAGSSVEFEDARVGYVAVQIDRATWLAVRAYLARRET